ncbi:telomere-protecting terminal protein Tpg [Streptomyces sp. NBC_01643]|uniref:telomere-protecting terminal protein Tpg n=1 Tax=Streptomyces sp. NBC_01643 TaxID=2975906 RepID=UPI002F9068DD|nr:XRE family transcriptional regulator [Streptomyces sp. NBC_01643]WTD39907.1 XRE family transcriptional regulator [Streptomyces sp. NBC_01643]
MGVVGESLGHAVAATATRPIPRSAGAQVRFLVKRLKGTRPVADLLGVSQRTVERYVRDQIKTPRAQLAARLADEVRTRWQPRVKENAKKNAAASTGIVVETRARFGFTAAPGSTDDGRIRRITQHLPATYAARLFDAQAAGAPEQQLQAVLAEGLQQEYFKDRGRRADGLLVEFTDIDYVELSF